MYLQDLNPSAKQPTAGHGFMDPSPEDADNPCGFSLLFSVYLFASWDIIFIACLRQFIG